MPSRMSKYNDDLPMSRTNRNQSLYQELNEINLENFNVDNNTTVLNEYDENIDITKLKKILDNKYNEAPRQSIQLEEDDEEEVEREITKEYDINTILNKAREENPLSYEEEKSKKIRDTQYDILKKLELEDEEELEKTNLLDLINTININETKIQTDMELFKDLKSEEKEEVTEQIKKPDIQEQTFFSSSTKFNVRDFEESSGEKCKKRNLFSEILVTLILVAFLIGIFIFIKSLI